MYREHYGLMRLPFEMTPDPSMLYLGEAHREGLATLVYAVQAGKGFVVLTGEVGTGKRWIKIKQGLAPSHKIAVAYIDRPNNACSR